MQNHSIQQARAPLSQKSWRARGGKPTWWKQAANVIHIVRLVGDELDRKLAETMASYWTNFAKRGDPNGAGLPIWPSFTEGEEWVLHLKDPIAVEGVANRPALALLDAIFAQARTS